MGRVPPSLSLKNLREDSSTVRQGVRTKPREGVWGDPPLQEGPRLGVTGERRRDWEVKGQDPFRFIGEGKRGGKGRRGETRVGTVHPTVHMDNWNRPRPLNNLGGGLVKGRMRRPSRGRVGGVLASPDRPVLLGVRPQLHPPTIRCPESVLLREDTGSPYRGVEGLIFASEEVQPGLQGETERRERETCGRREKNLDPTGTDGQFKDTRKFRFEFVETHGRNWEKKKIKKGSVRE